MTPPPGITFSGRASINGTTLFGPLTLHITRGQWTCLLGSSGVGKSTILRLVAGLATGVRFEGTIVADDGQPLHSRVGFMAQSDLLMPWLDVFGNVTLGARLRGERPDAARARAVIGRVGLASHIGKRPHALSGGERQRVALARTLMEDRPVILLDEPFSALDARTRADMQELARELLNGRTVMLVTHDPGEAARLGHRIIVMTAGHLHQMEVPDSPPIRAVDDPATLACQGALYRTLREGL
jgi:putative hydroxymethylpyrimidine transport system ATP-binding protein